jgi:two-component sensor histidine kinase
MLVLSELVSNAVRHAAPLPTGEIVVRWQVQDECLHVEITDGGAGTRPHASVAALSAVGGRGLDIVRAVSAQWGVTEGEGSVTVWAEVPRTPHDEAGPAAD